jgi:chromosome partitioning protein
MPIILLCNLKGGVAKTTSAVAIAECLASRGHRTLLIDADHQCMAGELLLGEDSQIRCDVGRRTLHDLLADMLTHGFDARRCEACVTRKASNIGGGISNLSVMPCSFRIDDFSTNMAKARRGYNSTEEFQHVLDRYKTQFRRWLQSEFDYTVVDCPPSVALQVRFLLSVGDGYVIPAIPDRLSVRGSLYLLQRLEKGNFKIPPLGTLWSLYRTQNAMHRKFVELAGQGHVQFARLPEPFKTVIPNAAKIAESTETGQKPTTFRQKYTSEFAQLFESLCDEMISRSRPKLTAPTATPLPSRDSVAAAHAGSWKDDHEKVAASSGGTQVAAKLGSSFKPGSTGGGEKSGRR